MQYLTHKNVAVDSLSFVVHIQDCELGHNLDSQHQLHRHWALPPGSSGILPGGQEAMEPEAPVPYLPSLFKDINI